MARVRESVWEKHLRLEGTDHVTWINANLCEVLGDHDLYSVRRNPSFECGFTCECKYFFFTSKPCSHILSAKLAEVTGGGLVPMMEGTGIWYTEGKQS